MDEQKRKEIIQLQQECSYFKNIYNFLKKGTLPDDQKRAYAIPHEANQYVLMNDVLRKNHSAVSCTNFTQE